MEHITMSHVIELKCKLDESCDNKKKAIIGLQQSKLALATTASSRNT